MSRKSGLVGRRNRPLGGAWLTARAKKSAATRQATPKPENAANGQPGPFLTEKQVSSLCRKMIDAVGGFTYNLSQPRASLQTPGLPDALAFVEGPEGMEFAFLEFKRPASPGKRAGKQSAAQVEFQEFARSAGLVYVVGGVPEVRQWLTDLGRIAC